MTAPTIYRFASTEVLEGAGEMLVRWLEGWDRVSPEMILCVPGPLPRPDDPAACNATVDRVRLQRAPGFEPGKAWRCADRQSEDVIVRMLSERKP